jgi:hypothetical protein
MAGLSVKVSASGFGIGSGFGAAIGWANLPSPQPFPKGEGVFGVTGGDGVFRLRRGTVSLPSPRPSPKGRGGFGHGAVAPDAVDAKMREQSHDSVRVDMLFA